MTSFENLGLSDDLLAVIEACGYTEPTPVQEKTIPLILMGRDVLGSAQTGTGKTASFLLPMIDILSSGKAKARLPRSLILAPTRELAAQVAEAFTDLSKKHTLNSALLIGGVNLAEQAAALNKGVDVLIATPGRLLDHLERGAVLLHDVKILVIDEADRMLDMGFIPDVEKITGLLPKIRQTLFFSATLSDPIYKISEKFVLNPKIVEVTPQATTADTVEQFILTVDSRKKRAGFMTLLENENITNAVIFCNRKRDISGLKSALEKDGYNVVSLHGDMTQSARNAALNQFSQGEVPLMVASDVAARGLDIKGLSHVFNFDIPHNPEDYIHRIGRTGRAGESGRAFTLIATEDDQKSLAAITQFIGSDIEEITPEKSASVRKKTPPSSKKTAPAQEENTPSPKKPQAPKSQTRRSDGRRSDSQYPDERTPPPDCSGDSFQDNQHTPAFLLGRKDL